MELEAVLALCVVQLGSGVERHVQGPEDNGQDKSQCTADRSRGEVCHLTAVECQQSPGPASILDAQDCHPLHGQYSSVLLHQPEEWTKSSIYVG